VYLHVRNDVIYIKYVNYVESIYRLIYLDTWASRYRPFWRILRNVFFTKWTRQKISNY